MKLIVGLGNPGKQYTNTRHNIGWRILDALKSQFEPKSKWIKQTKFDSEVCQLSTACPELRRGVNGQLCKPLTFMNLSGTAVQKLVNFYKLDPKTDLLVVHDDKDLMFGTMKLESGRSSAGQKGVQNIIETLGTKDFLRLRFGVGQKERSLPTEAFVLQPFNTEEESLLPDLLKKAGEIVRTKFLSY